MNPFGNLGQFPGSAVHPAMMANSWKPEHPPKQESLTQVLNQALTKLRAIEARVHSAKGKVGQGSTGAACLGGAAALPDTPSYTAGEASGEIRSVVERLDKLVAELDELL